MTSIYEIGTVYTRSKGKSRILGFVPVERFANGKRRWLTAGYQKTKEAAEIKLAELTREQAKD